MTFKDLVFEETFEGVQAIVELKNGYEVSVVRNGLSYGGDKGLYEIGVFSGESMVDPLNWGDTVKGWLSPSDVTEQLKLIEAA